MVPREALGRGVQAVIRMDESYGAGRQQSHHPAGHDELVSVFHGKTARQFSIRRKACELVA